MLVSSLVAAIALAVAYPAANPPTSPAANPPTPAGPVAASPSLRPSVEVLALGEFVAGTPKSGTVTFTNASGQPLTIAKIVPACGCTTVVGTPTSPVAAGASFTLTLTVDPGMKTGIDLAKQVTIAFDGGGTQVYKITGHVKTVVRVAPDVVDASASPEGANGVLTLESADQGLFTVTGIEPSGVATASKGAAARHTVTIDWKAWAANGKPNKLTIATDKADATTLVVPIKLAPAVAMFRVPAMGGEGADVANAGAVEAAQDEVIHAIDAGLDGRQSKEFRVKLHREAGMLFVHGTEADIERVRSVVSRLPAESGVRESTH